MSIKTNSKLLLTVFLAGSLSGYVNASQDDKIEEEGSRLQITGAYNLLSAQIDALGSDLTGTTAAKVVAAVRVAGLAVNPVINAVVLTGADLVAYNAAVAVVAPLITTALTTPSYANILAVQTSVTSLLAAAAGTLSTPYATASVLAAVTQLDAAVDTWLALYPA